MPLSRRKKTIGVGEIEAIVARIARIRKKPFPAVTKICCVTSTAA